MRRRVFPIIVMTGLSAAEARAQEPKPVLASVDESGRVLPLAPAQTPVQRVEKNSSTAVCPYVAAIPRADAQALVRKIAEKENFYPDFVISVAKIESRFDSTAVSPKGAYGLMQLMPETAKRFQVNPCDPADNILGGVRLLRTLHEKYKNPFFILAAYNAGEEAVQKAKGVPPFPETVAYVAKVMNDFYDWPEIGARKKRKPRPAQPEPAKANETAAPARPVASRPHEKAAAEASFVMHID